MTVYYFPLTEEEGLKDSAKFKGLDYALTNKGRLVSGASDLINTAITTDFARYIKRIVIDGIVYDPNMEYYDITNDIVIIICIPRSGPDKLSEDSITNLNSLA